MSRFPGAVVGFRTWTIAGGKLWPATAVHYDHDTDSIEIDEDAEPWVNGEPSSARCMNSYSPHYEPAPAAGCHCGFNVFYDPPSNLYGFNATVLGAVVCWGRAIHQSNGFRSEFALPVALCELPTMQVGARDAAMAYASEWELPYCTTAEELLAEALRYAEVVPEKDRTRRGDVGLRPSRRLAGGLVIPASAPPKMKPRRDPLPRVGGSVFGQAPKRHRR